MALLILSVCIALFVGIHLIPMAPDWRAKLVARLGENVYRAGFSLVSAVGLFGAIISYRFTPDMPLWETPVPLRAFSVLLMLVSVLCFAAAKQTAWFKRIVRHPMLWGIGLLGVAHLIANGEVPGLILFGALALFGFVWQPLTDRRDAITKPRQWEKTKATTSLWPFASWNAQGADAPAVTVKPLLIGAVVFIVLILAHPYLFGAAVIPR